MHVYGEIAEFDFLAEAEAYVDGLTWPPPSISGWYGFYQERGEQVTAIGFTSGVAHTYEYSGGMNDFIVIDSYSFSSRQVGSFEVLECAWESDIEEWEEPVRPPAPERGPARGEPWEVEGWSYDLLSGTWLEAPMPELSTWFLVTRYWGFATRVGANKFHVFGG